MANEHPFQHLFETLGRTPIAHAESVNRQAYQVLSDILTVPLEKTGRCILLRASRAGHGKTHLLSRIQHQLGANHEFIPLHAAFGCRIDAGSVIDDTLRCLVRQLPASGGLCVLDLVTRRLFASALQPLVASGEVPCQDREGALTALRMRPVETFDFHHPNAVTAHWARENFEVLGQRLSLELAQRAGLPVREVAFWVDALFRFASAPLDHAGRVSSLAGLVHQSAGGEMERLEALLGLLTQLMRVVLVADDLEGFSSDETAALRFGAFLGSLRQSVDRLDVILSLNLDIWESAFVPRLSGGLADRLSEVVVELEPLKEAEMAALLDSRVPGLGSKVLERIDVGASGRHARGLIRAAGLAWLKATAMDSAPAAEPVPEVVPPPMANALPEVVAMAPAFAPAEPEPPRVPEPVAVEEPVVEATAPAFSFVAEITPLAEPEPIWPAPEFAPPPPVELERESPAPPPADTGFSQSPAPEPTAGYSWNPPAPAGGSQSVEESPFQIETPTYQAPQEPFIPQADFQPQMESPFQANQDFNTFNPPAETPVELKAEIPRFEETPPPFLPAEPFLQESSFQQGDFQPTTNPPFQAAPQEFTPAPPEPQMNFQPQVDSPFQPAPQSFSPPEPAPPQEFFQPQVESTFQASPVNFTPVEHAPSFQPAPEPAPEAAFVPANEPPPPTTADTDRVDDLLRQFRERYGRGSL